MVVRLMALAVNVQAVTPRHHLIHAKVLVVRLPSAAVLPAVPATPPQHLVVLLFAQAVTKNLMNLMILARV